MANKLNGAKVHNMVRHWLKTPVNGYLGSSYGSAPQDLLQKPMSSGLGDAFVAKLKQDVPVIGLLPGATDVYFEDKGIDTKILHIDVLDSLVSIDSLGNIA